MMGEHCNYNKQIERMHKSVKIQILLSPSARTAEGVAKARKVAERLGIKPTTSGAASIVAQVDSNRFASLFGAVPQDALTAAPLEIPKALRPYVDTITIAPPHIFMDGPSERS